MVTRTRTLIVLLLTLTIAGCETSEGNEAPTSSEEVAREVGISTNGGVPSYTMAVVSPSGDMGETVVGERHISPPALTLNDAVRFLAHQARYYQNYDYYSTRMVPTLYGFEGFWDEGREEVTHILYPHIFTDDGGSVQSILFEVGIAIDTQTHYGEGESYKLRGYSIQTLPCWEEQGSESKLFRATFDGHPNKRPDINLVTVFDIDVAKDWSNIQEACLWAGASSPSSMNQ